jgi:hypothetical protein
MAKIFSQQVNPTQVSEAKEKEALLDNGNLLPIKQTQEPKVASFGGMNNTASDSATTDPNIFAES